MLPRTDSDSEDFPPVNPNHVNRQLKSSKAPKHMVSESETSATDAEKKSKKSRPGKRDRIQSKIMNGEDEKKPGK